MIRIVDVQVCPKGTPLGSPLDLRSDARPTGSSGRRNRSPSDATQLATYSQRIHGIKAKFDLSSLFPEGMPSARGTGGGLFHRYTLCQVSRLIDIIILGYANVICK